ncbi:Activator of Hsp90 ATPase homolog 1-like protein [Mycobacteroides abscessus subsp. abscessus]|uniref:SRPBCC domain-containing protein n=1 Tax=Mycobacteroides abscessus TaxID=36809 RepID=UPI00092C3209|nr:SRPBCC domain-containing protein [Mycobacteroides abscessus]SHR99264.1 Activator of Hsp90 ATPase homolog 1-like protein [Mycobacteroides abscessus subsp. abscessus]
MTRTDTASVHIPATQAAVFAALVDPAALVVWLPPDGMIGTLTEYAPGPGGRFRMVLTYQDPDAADPKSSADADIVEVRVTEVVPDTKLVWEADFDSGDPRFAGTMTMTWTTEADGDGTLVTVTATDVPAGIDAADHQEGLRSSLRQLREYVAG